MTYRQVWRATVHVPLANGGWWRRRGRFNVLTCLTIIGAAVYMVVTGKPIEGPLKEWASTCLGFLFATFVPLVKDFISK
jgi:hypothetical protein